MELTSAVLDPGFTTDTFAGAQPFQENLIGYYLVIAGLFFCTGYVMILSFHRQKRMTGSGEQFQYILRDETTHLNFGIDLSAASRRKTARCGHRRSSNARLTGCEEPSSWRWLCARDYLPQATLGLNGDLFRDYV